MVRIYRRHVKSCPHTSERERRCKCPIHVSGTVGIERISPQSLNLTSWEAAQRKVREWETAGTMKAAAPKITLKEAVAGYLADCEARNLALSTFQKTEGLMKALVNFAERESIASLESVGVTELRQFRATWKTWGPAVQVKMIERLRAFFSFCIQSKWISESPAKFVKPPKVESTKVAVFSDEDLAKIHAAIGRPIMRAFILVLETTGLRIGDATMLRRQDIVDGRLLIRTKKTGSEVWLPLPPYTLAALSELRTTEYYFWTGESKHSTAVGSRRRGVAKLMARAGVKGNPHMFRHTLATRLLANGTSPAVVAKILGNTEKIVMKYYDHWIPSRQRLLEAELEKSWAAPKLVRVK